jgi:4-diphosphocytidyl-2-C-methyl-D-erythritol kinase
VLGKRADGYHELFGLMARLDLADEITVSPSDSSGDILTYRGLEPGSFDNGFTGTSNLALRAVRLYRQLTGWPPQSVAIDLVKKIPLGSGLGGGSSDAAAVLRLLNQSELMAPERLAAVAVSLGGDVPFFLEDGPLRLAGGIGELLRPYRGKLPGRWLLLINPGFHLSTAVVFKQLGLTTWESSSNSLFSVEGIEGCSGDDRTPELGENDLFRPASELRPELLKISRLLTRLIPAPLAAGLSGSGPTFWALFREDFEAEEAQANFERLIGNGSVFGSGWWLRVTTIA